MKHSFKATLIMEAKGVAPSVRAGGFASGWSRLYQAEDYYLDVMLKPEGSDFKLIGQVIREGHMFFQGRAYLNGTYGVQETPFGVVGGFVFDVEASQTYSLDVLIEGQHIHIVTLACC